MAENSLLVDAFSPAVGIARLPSADYPPLDGSAAEWNGNPVSQALERLANALGWANENGPFGRVVPDGARVLIKPNLVLHQNENDQRKDPAQTARDSLNCLVTHASLIRAAVEAALRTGAREVLWVMPRSRGATSRR